MVKCEWDAEPEHYGNTRHAEDSDENDSDDDETLTTILVVILLS